MFFRPERPGSLPLGPRFHECAECDNKKAKTFLLKFACNADLRPLNWLHDHE